MNQATPIAIAYGDGIGPELMQQTLLALRETGVPLAIETIEIGQRIYAMNGKYGLVRSAFDTLKRVKILLKAPCAPPENVDFQEVSSAIRERFKLDASCRIIGYDSSGKRALATAYINENFALFEPLAPPTSLENMLCAAQMLLEHIGQNHVLLKLTGQPENIAV